MPVYDYRVPNGFGDCFYQYAYNADSLTNGNSYSKLKIDVRNYDFICRHWAGWETVVDTPANGGSVQAYDGIQRTWAAIPMQFGSFPQGQVVLPEKRYAVNSQIQFDLNTVLKDASGGQTASQLVFTGVRRIPGAASDPQPSDFPAFKRVPFFYGNKDVSPFALTVQQAPVAPVRYRVEVKDYDFELERIELTPYTAVSPFSIVLYDTNMIQRSNLPINANRFFHFNPAASSGELNFWPSPPLLYKTNSAITFDIYSLVPAGPITYQLQFVGMRRIPCA